MCRLYWGQTTAVRGRIHLLKRATACEINGRTCRLCRWFCPMSLPKSHGRRTQPARELCWYAYHSVFVVKASKSVPGSKMDSRSRAGTKRLIDRDHQHPHPPTFFTILFFLSTYSSFLSTICPHPTRVSTKTAATYMMIAFPDRKINKYLVRGTTYFKIQVNSANFPLLFPPSSTGCSTSSMNAFEAGRRPR